MSGQAVADAILGLFGLARAEIGEWPDSVVSTAVAVIKENGGEFLNTTGSPAGGFDVLRFRCRGRRIRLCCGEFGEVTLWGPKQLVRELSELIAARLAMVSRLPANR
jgi:hypothetical protein